MTSTGENVLAGSLKLAILTSFQSIHTNLDVEWFSVANFDAATTVKVVLLSNTRCDYFSIILVLRTTHARQTCARYAEGESRGLPINLGQIGRTR